MRQFHLNQDLASRPMTAEAQPHEYLVTACLRFHRLDLERPQARPFPQSDGFRGAGRRTSLCGRTELSVSAWDKLRNGAVALRASCRATSKAARVALGPILD